MLDASFIGVFLVFLWAYLNFLPAIWAKARINFYIFHGLKAVAILTTLVLQHFLYLLIPNYYPVMRKCNY